MCAQGLDKSPFSSANPVFLRQGTQFENDPKICTPLLLGPRTSVTRGQNVPSVQMRKWVDEEGPAL